MGELQQSTITIDSVAVKNGRHSIKSREGGSYSFFEKKQDGNNTMAYQQFIDMGLKDGMTVDIAYDTTTSPNKQGGTITYKNIKSFREPSIQVNESVSEKVQKSTKTEMPDWDSINFGKCKHNFLIESYKLGEKLDMAEIKAEDWAEASMRKLEKEPDVSNIPF